MSDNPYVNKTLHNPVCTRPPVCADIPASQYKQKAWMTTARRRGGVTVTNGWGKDNGTKSNLQLCQAHTLTLFNASLPYHTISLDRCHFTP